MIQNFFLFYIVFLNTYISFNIKNVFKINDVLSGKVKALGPKGNLFSCLLNFVVSLYLIVVVSSCLKQQTSEKISAF